MNVRQEIENYSEAEDKPCLQWLFDKYHEAAQWKFVSKCRIVGTHYPNTHRLWRPSDEGRILYGAAMKNQDEQMLLAEAARKKAEAERDKYQAALGKMIELAHDYDQRGLMWKVQFAEIEAIANQEAGL